MGFKVSKTLVVVDFPPESPYHGAEVKMALTIKNILDMKELMDEEGNVDVSNTDSVITLLMSFIQEWNLEDEAGNPLPITADAFREHVDIPFMAAMFLGFAKAFTSITEVELPLQQASNAGAI